MSEIIFPQELVTPYELDWGNPLVSALTSNGADIFITDDNLATVTNVTYDTGGTSTDITDNEQGVELDGYRVGVDTSSLTAQQQSDIDDNPYQLFKTEETKRDEYCISLTTGSEQISLPFTGAFTGELLLDDDTTQAISGSGTYVVDGTTPKRIKSISATDSVSSYLWIFDRQDSPATIADEYNGTIAPLAGSPTFERIIELQSFDINGGNNDYTTATAFESAVENSTGHNVGNVYGTVTISNITDQAGILELRAAAGEECDFNGNGAKITGSGDIITARNSSSVILSNLNIDTTLRPSDDGVEIIGCHVFVSGDYGIELTGDYDTLVKSTKFSGCNRAIYSTSVKTRPRVYDCLFVDNGDYNVLRVPLINCVATGATTADFFLIDDVNCVTSDSSASGTGSQTNATITLNANGLLDQTTQDTYLKGKGWNGSDIASVFYAIGGGFQSAWAINSNIVLQ